MRKLHVDLDNCLESCNETDMMIVIEIGYGFSILWVLIWIIFIDCFGLVGVLF